MHVSNTTCLFAQLGEAHPSVPLCGEVQHSTTYLHGQIVLRTIMCGHLSPPPLPLAADWAVM